eukprot:1141311-Pelagomonas_calceolata.AAC.2
MLHSNCSPGTGVDLVGLHPSVPGAERAMQLGKRASCRCLHLYDPDTDNQRTCFNPGCRASNVQKLTWRAKGGAHPPAQSCMLYTAGLCAAAAKTLRPREG